MSTMFVKVSFLLSLRPLTLAFLGPTLRHRWLVREHPFPLLLRLEGHLTTLCPERQTSLHEVGVA